MTDYEKNLAERKAKEAEGRERLKKILITIGFTPETDDDPWGARVRGKREDGASCMLTLDGYRQAGRVGFSAWTPDPQNGTRIKTPDAITMAASKEDEKIAAEIKKRYLMAFDPCMEEYRKAYKAARGAEAAQDALVAGCAQLLGYPAPERQQTSEKPRLYKYPDSEHVKKVTVETDYDGTEARLELALSPEAAMLVCQKLGEWIKKEAGK